jgi:hypothetical protein
MKVGDDPSYVAKPRRSAQRLPVCAKRGDFSERMFCTTHPWGSRWSSTREVIRSGRRTPIAGVLKNESACPCLVPRQSISSPVNAPYRVVHESNPYSNGDELTVPDQRSHTGNVHAELSESNDERRLVRYGPCVEVLTQTSRADLTASTCDWRTADARPCGRRAAGCSADIQPAGDLPPLSSHAASRHDGRTSSGRRGGAGTACAA